LKSALKAPAPANSPPALNAGELQGQYHCRSCLVAILAIAAAFTILTATIFPTGIFAASKLSAGTFTALKFPPILAVTEFPTGIFPTFELATVLTATKLGTVLATTILTTLANITLMVWASGGAQG